MEKTDLHLSIDADLLKRAEAAGIDPSEALEEALAARLDAGVRDQGRPFEDQTNDAEARATRWALENAEAIREHNDRIAERGLIGADWRRW